MVLDATSALGAMTGARFIESLRDGREVWLDGEKVQDVTTHPALSGIAHELARIYDFFSADISGAPTHLPTGEEIVSSVIDLRLSEVI